MGELVDEHPPTDMDLLNRFSNFLVNLVHAVALVPVIDHDVVAVGETVQFFTVPSVNGGKIAVVVVVVAHQFLTIEGDGSETVCRRRERRFSRGRPYTV